MIPQGGGFAPPPGGSLHSLATEKFEFRVIVLERDFFDFSEMCSKPEILYFTAIVLQLQQKSGMGLIKLQWALL